MFEYSVCVCCGADGPLEPISPACIDFLSGLLEPCPSKRMTMDQIWSHPWFKAGLPQGARQYNIHLATEQQQNPESYQRQSEEDLKRLVQLA